MDVIKFSLDLLLLVAMIEAVRADMACFDEMDDCEDRADAGYCYGLNQWLDEVDHLKMSNYSIDIASHTLGTSILIGGLNKGL
jgi:hypothetical protein